MNGYPVLYITMLAMLVLWLGVVFIGGLWAGFRTKMQHETVQGIVLALSVFWYSASGLLAITFNGSDAFPFSQKLFVIMTVSFFLTFLVSIVSSSLGFDIGRSLAAVTGQEANSGELETVREVA